MIINSKDDIISRKIIIYAAKSRGTPQTEEIGLQIFMTAKIFDTFLQESPYISNTFSREFPKFQKEFQTE